MQYEADSFYELAQAQALYSIVGSFHSNYHSKEGTHDHISGIKEGGNTIILGGAGPMGLMAIRYVLGMKKKPRRLVITDTNQERLEKVRKMAYFWGSRSCASFRIASHRRSQNGGAQRFQMPPSLGGLNMNKGELVAAVAEKAGLTRTQAGEAVDATIAVITGALKKGDEVKIVGFGTFVVTKRAAGEARNPRTGEKVKVPASKTPKFRAGAGLKEAVNSK